MASIEQQLEREDWEPVPGDQIVGEITGIKIRTGKSEKPYPVLIVKDDDGAEHIVSCAFFAADVIEHRPSVGERVGVKFWGPQERSDGGGTWNKYSVAFEKERVTEVIWDDIAALRGMRAAGNGSTATAAASGTDDDLWTAPPPAGPW